MTDQPSLRDRIRRAICEASGFEFDPEGLEPDEFGEHADAVLAVLPADLAQAIEQRDYWHAELMCADARIAELERKRAVVLPTPVDWPAVLREAADRLVAITHPACVRDGECCWHVAVAALRRMADEAQQPEDAGR